MVMATEKENDIGIDISKLDSKRIMVQFEKILAMLEDRSWTSEVLEGWIVSTLVYKAVLGAMVHGASLCGDDTTALDFLQGIEHTMNRLDLKLPEKEDAT